MTTFPGQEHWPSLPMADSSSDSIEAELKNLLPSPPKQFGVFYLLGIDRLKGIGKTSGSLSTQ